MLKHCSDKQSTRTEAVLLLAAAHGENRGGRFQNVTELRLAGLEVTDAVSRLLVRYLPHLAKLDLSQCCHITDQTVHTLTSPISPLRESLTHVSLAGTDPHPSPSCSSLNVMQYQAVTSFNVFRGGLAIPQRKSQIK